MSRHLDRVKLVCDTAFSKMRKVPGFFLTFLFFYGVAAKVNLLGLQVSWHIMRSATEYSTRGGQLFKIQKEEWGRMLTKEINGFRLMTRKCYEEKLNSLKNLALEVVWFGK